MLVLIHDDQLMLTGTLCTDDEYERSIAHAQKGGTGELPYTYLERFVYCQPILWIIEPVRVAVVLNVHYALPTQRILHFVLGLSENSGSYYNVRAAVWSNA